MTSSLHAEYHILGIQKNLTILILTSKKGEISDTLKVFKQRDNSLISCGGLLLSPVLPLLFQISQFSPLFFISFSLCLSQQLQTAEHFGAFLTAFQADSVQRFITVWQ